MGLNQSTHGTGAPTPFAICTGDRGDLPPGSGPFPSPGNRTPWVAARWGIWGRVAGATLGTGRKDRAFVEQLWQRPPGTLRADCGDGTVALFDEMCAGRIKACWIICTNPVASVPNRQKVIAGLQRAELVIAQDAFLDTETNRYADILLPGALWAEAEGVMVNSERTMTLMQQAVTPPGEALADWQIIAQVACEMGYADGFTYARASDVFDELRRGVEPGYWL